RLIARVLSASPNRARRSACKRRCRNRSRETEVSDQHREAREGSSTKQGGKMKVIFANLMRSLPIRGEEGWVTPRTAMALTIALLVVLGGVVGRDLAAQAT